MRIINVTPLLAQHQEEQSEDLRQLQRDCGITDVAFSMALHPEERRPTTAKAEYLCGLFDRMRQSLQDSPLQIGILLQSLMGHGVPTTADFTRTVNDQNLTTQAMCPLDENFRTYLRRVIGIVAAARPKFLLVDDDFRLGNRGGTGCFCDLHRTGFNQITGNNYTRQSLLAALAESEDLHQRWDAFRSETLYQAARIIRRAIDEVDPSIPCGLCCSSNPDELAFYPTVARILAGNHPPFIRIANSFYLDHHPGGLAARIYWTAVQMNALNDIPELLAESDTYPHNRYYTSAKALHSQFVYSLLNGTTGAKLWITRMSEYEPESGLAYRKMLRDHLGFYHVLRELYPQIRWDEPLTPLPRRIPAALPAIVSGNWTTAVGAHLGIPMRVAKPANDPVVMLSGPETDSFRDAEIQDFLSRGLLLDGIAAEKLSRRGFSVLLGVDAELPPNWSFVEEHLNCHAANGDDADKVISLTSFLEIKARRLRPNNPGTEVLSELRFRPWYRSPDAQEVGAGMTRFENRLGGRVAILAAGIGVMEYLNEIRRRQLVMTLDWLNRRPLPAIVLADLDVYARHGVIVSPGGDELLAIFNLNPDTLPELHLRLAGTSLKTVALLQDNGEWRDLPFFQQDDRVNLAVPLESLTPMILRLRRDPA